MTASLLPNAKASFQAASGVPLVGGKVYTYAAGTSTPQTTWQDAAQTTPNANPIILDARGEASIFWSGNYKVQLKDATDALIWTQDNIASSDLAQSTGSAGIGFIQSGTGAVLRTVQDKLRERRTVRDYGAAIDGVTDTRTAFVNADAGGQILVTQGNYLIATNLTITNDVEFAPGAIIVVPNAVTVTFTGNIKAGISQIFSCTGTGKVVLNTVKNRVGYPEWWGALANVSTGGTPAANAAAINAAIVALGRVELMPSDYYISATIFHNTANGWLMGAGGKYDSVNGLRCTRIIMTDGITDILQVGPNANPGSIGLFTQNTRVTNLFLCRSVAPGVVAGAASVRVQYVLEAYFDDVCAYDSIVGWVFNGTVHTIAYNCSAKRQAAGTGGTDNWKGFYIYGGSGIAAGGNASLYLSYCHADDNRTVKTNSIGFYADQKFTDLYILHCETVACTVGIEIAGNSAVTNDSGSTDLTIIQPIMDAFAVYGIYLHNFGYSGSAEIHAPYCGPASGATSAIQISNCLDSAISIIGGQMVMASAPTCKGITIDTSKGVRIEGTIIAEAGSNGAVVLSNVEHCWISPTVLNKVTSGGPAVQLLNACTANVIEPMLNGKAAGVTFGIQVVGTGDNRNEYRMTGLDSSVVSGGAANKLFRNGVSITAAFTLTGTNTTSGVMT